MTPSKWGLPKSVFRRLCRLHNRVFEPPFAIDAPEKSMLGSKYWHNYKIKNYNYTYNSFGCRGQDYEQYLGQPVNICIGDSSTVNIGGPVEHSWPYQLSKYFDIPTLNFGIDGLSYYDMAQLVERIKGRYKVDKLFVLYNLFDGDDEPINLPIPVYNRSIVHNNANITGKIKVFKQYCQIPGAYWQFDPPWMFEADELPCLYEHFPNAHDYLKNKKIDYRTIDIDALLDNDQLRLKYVDLSGPSWPSYEIFCEHVLSNQNFNLIYNLPLDQRLIQEFLTINVIPFVEQVFNTNRDGWHHSQYLNKLLADYFYQQTQLIHQGEFK